MDAARNPPPTRRWLSRSAWAAGGLAAVVVAAGGWLLATESGARFALERALALAGGRAAGVEGRLVGPLAVDALDIDTPGLRVRARRATLDWSPLRLLVGEVRVDRLHAAEVEIATAPATGAARVPATLVPAIRLFVARAGVDRLRVGALGDEAGGVELREVTLGLAGDRAAWILGDALALTPFGRVKLSGTLGAQAPFPLDAKGELSGTRNGADWRASVEAKGPLARFEARLAAREGGLAGTGSASLEPFSATPLRRLVVDLEGVDLGSFMAAPRTNLAVKADLSPAGAALLAGPASVVNAMPGPLDRDRLPVVSAAARLAIAPDRVEATNVSIAFAGSGRAEGEAAFAGGRLDAQLVVKEADLLAWHSSLRATRLSGSVAAVATAGSQSFTVALADPRFAIQGDARIADGLLAVDKVRLSRGEAFAEASGSLALAGGREFRVEGRIGNLDPAAFAKVPAGDLNATFAATGTFARGPAGELVLDIAKSRFADLSAQGHATLVADGERLTRAVADLSLGATRLRADGALGAPGDTLAVTLASPDLAPIGRAFGLALGGRVDLEASVAGTFAALSGRAALDAKDLVLPGGTRVAALVARVELGAGEAGAASGQADLRGYSQGKDGKAIVERAAIAIKGTRLAHEIRVEADFADDLRARGLLDGGLVAGARLPQWRGRLESLALSGRADFALAAPAALVVSAERVELGEARFAGEPGEVRFAAVRWTPAGFESRGSSSAVVVRSVRRILDLQGAVGSNLVLAGEWDVRVGETVDGFVAIRRERGEVRVGEPRQALGLEVLSIRADASGGRVTAAADIRGTQAGRWKGEASFVLARGDGGWEVSPAAPIEGRFTVDVPDLAWMAAWIGPEARMGGHLKGEGTLAGTARDPEWRGRVEVSGLSVREPAQGADVADGDIVVVLEDRQARIERFALSMPWEPSAEAARAIGAAPRPAAGTLTAEGAIDLGTRKGTIRLKATGYPLTRLPTRFLAVSGEGRVEMDGRLSVVTGDFTADAGWFGIPASAPPSLSDDVIVDRAGEAPAAARAAERIRLDLRVDLGEHLYFRGRGLATRLAGSLRLAGEVGANLRTTGNIRAVGGTYDAYGQTLAIERGALNFQGAIDNPGINVLALRKGLAVEAGVEVLGTVARPKVRLVSSPEVPEPEKLAWLVLGRGQGEVTGGDAGTLIAAANALLGSEAMPTTRLLGGLGIDDLRLGREDSGALGTLPQSTVAGRTGQATAAEVVTVGKRLTDDLYVSYRQGLADAEGSLRVAWQLTRNLQIILRAGYLPGIDAVYRFSFD